MTTTNSPQELGRTDDVHDHDSKLFCIRCITNDTERDDALGDAALLAMIELKQLAQTRITLMRLSCTEAWRAILDREWFEDDLHGDNDELAMAAMRVRETLDDYFSLRVLMRYSSPKPLILAHAERSIQKRVQAKLDQIELEGTDANIVAAAH